MEPPRTSETREVTDDLGRKVIVPVNIDRAVSLAPNLTEDVFAVGAGNKLVGVTTYCDYPEAARKIQKVGDTLNPNIETIVALKPQIVLVSTASQLEAFSKTLADNGIAVYVTSSKSLDDVFKNLAQLGEIFGTQDIATKVVADLTNRVESVSRISSSKKAVRVFVQISKEPLFTVGKQAFVTEIVKRAGGESATENIETAYPNLSKETALALEPDVIILSDSPDNQEPNDAFKNSPAVKNGRVFRVNADLLSRPGPRLVDALEQIAEDLRDKRGS
ncbi:MAG TPA: cobalamin-binding protein [Pyrinomonadaceae bacterium]|nr:cobalamin-binding protein [Pyrinomonadaceae bacterium]